MGTFEFRCDRCSEVVEIRKRISDPHPKSHRGCGGSLKRIFTAPGISFRGQGFYATDGRSRPKPSKG